MELIPGWRIFIVAKKIGHLRNSEMLFFEDRRTCVLIDVDKIMMSYR